MTNKEKLPRGLYRRYDGILYLRYQDETGRIVRESTCQRSVRAAESIADKRRTEVMMKTNFISRQYDSASFKELADYWWEHHGKYTRGGFEYLLPRITDKFARMRARQVDTDAIQTFLDDLRNTLSASSCNHYRTILNSIFNFSIKRKRFDVNPVRGIPQAKEPPGRDRFLTPPEFRRLLANCTDKELRAAVTVLATTTLRKSELLARRWSEVSISGSTPHIYVPETKNGEPKRVALPAVAIKALRGLPSFKRNEYLFPSRATTRHPMPERPYRWDIGKEFRAAVTAAKLSNVRIHDLRHIGATILMMEGIPNEVIRKVTGHRSKELERYQHLSEGLKSQTVNLIARRLFRSTATGTVIKTAKKGHQRRGLRVVK